MLPRIRLSCIVAMAVCLICSTTAFSQSSSFSFARHHGQHCRRWAGSNVADVKDSPLSVVTDDSSPNNIKSSPKQSPPTSVRHPKPLSPWTGIQFLLESFRGQTHHYLTRLMQQHGDCFIIWNQYVILNNKDAIRDVLEKYNLEKTPQVKRGYRFMFYRKGGILAAPWKAWIQQRRMTAPALQPRVIYQELLPKFNTGARPILTFLEQAASTGQTVEMDRVFTALTLDIIGLVLLGTSFGAGDLLLQEPSREVEFVSAMNTLTKEAIRQMTLPSKILKLFPPSFKVQDAMLHVDGFLDTCIQDRLQERQVGTANQTDMMNILLDAEQEGVITRDDVKGQLLTFLFAGHDTTAHTLSWLLYEVSLNEKLQDDLYHEAKAALPSSENVITSADILQQQLPLLERVWKETNRKHPAAATGTLRKVGNSPILVGDNIELPAKASVLIPPYSLHRNEEYWPNPEVFDPSRFTPDQEALRDDYTFQAFSGGPRSCIGSQLARAEALCVLAPLFRRYQVKCVEQGKIADYCSLTRRPRDGIPFQFTKRNE